MAGLPNEKKGKKKTEDMEGIRKEKDTHEPEMVV